MNLDDIKKAREAKKQKALNGGSNGLVVSSRREELATLKNTLSTKKNTIENRVAERSARVISQVGTLIRENTTEIVGIFDCSGSVEGTERVTVASYMDMLYKEKTKGYPTTVSTILFNDEEHLIHDRLDIHTVQPFSYKAIDGTMFFDTFCKHMKKINDKIKSLPENERPKKKLAVIMTDGGDNRSKKYGIEDARRLVEALGKEGWEFIYLCADRNLVNVAQLMGIKPQNIEMYLTDGIKHNFEAVSRALDDMHEKGAITPDWSRPIKNSRLQLTSGKDDNPNVLRLK